MPWKTLSSTTVLDHPYARVALERVQLPDGRVIPDWPRVHLKDYINVVVLDEAGRALVLTGYKHGLGRDSWQVVGGYLEPGEEPLAAARRELLEETGYASDSWRHLGSYVVDANREVGTGHFFLARDARPVAAPNNDDLEEYEIRWVPLPALRQALFDGRVAILSYAVNVSLALAALADL